MNSKTSSGPQPVSEPQPAAYGGPGWSARTASLRDEIGSLWHSCGISNEWNQLKSVLLHSPGKEIAAVADINAAQFLARPDLEELQTQHQALAGAYTKAGIEVHFVNPPWQPPPNQMYVADLMLMTPEGAIIGRAGSTVRAGEEVHIARRIADLGIPILASIRGGGTFEGADAAWLDSKTVLLGVGVRTNPAGADQVTNLLAALSVQVIRTNLPVGAMHLMGCLRFADRDLAIIRPEQLPEDARSLLVTMGYQVHTMPSEREIRSGQALNFVTLGPRRILVPSGTPKSHAFFNDLGLEFTEVEVSELIKCAGGIGCLTGVLERSSE
jgi:N-dimethylarginine dimethylaminohydrolase